MRRWRLPLLVLAIGVIVLSIIGRGDEPTDMNIAEAQASLEALHRRTAATVAPTSKPKVMSYGDLGPSTCYSDYLKRDLGTVSSQFNLVVPVPRGSERAVLDKVVAAWEREGIKLYRGRLDRRTPEVTGRADGYGVRVLAVPDSGQVPLTGQTDCLDPVPDR